MALSDNLVSWWKLDEAAGANNGADAHGSNTLVQLNSPGSASGKINTARDFEATTPHSFSRDSTTLRPGDTDFTVGGWVQIETKPGGGPGRICIKADGSNGEYHLEWDNSTDRFKFVVYGASGFGSSSSVLANDFGAVSEATMYFVVARHDSVNNFIRVSVNGTTTSAAHSAGIYSSTGLFYLGDPVFGAHWDGLMDEMFYFARHISDAEITELYNAGDGMSYEDVTGGGGGVIPDASNYYRMMGMR